MGRVHKLSDEELNKILERDYPHIIVKEGENLNIQDNISRIFKKVWSDTKAYPTVADASAAMGILPRRANRIRARLKLPYRFTFT